MTIYNNKSFGSSVKDVKNEADLIKLLQELKQCITALTYDPQYFRKEVVPEILGNKGNIKIDFGLIKLDISQATSAAQQYEEQRKRGCFNCSQYDVYHTGPDEQESHCKVDRKRTVPIFDNCQEGFENFKIKGKAKPLEVILGKI